MEPKLFPSLEANWGLIWQEKILRFLLESAIFPSLGCWSGRKSLCNSWWNLKFFYPLVPAGGWSGRKSFCNSSQKLRFFPSPGGRSGRKSAGGVFCHQFLLRGIHLQGHPEFFPPAEFLPSSLYPQEKELGLGMVCQDGEGGSGIQHSRFSQPGSFSQLDQQGWKDSPGGGGSKELLGRLRNLWALFQLSFGAFLVPWGQPNPRKTWNNQPRAQEMNGNGDFRQAGVYPGTRESDPSLVVSPEGVWGIFSPLCFRGVQTLWKCGDFGKWR